MILSLPNNNKIIIFNKESIKDFFFTKISDMPTNKIMNNIKEDIFIGCDGGGVAQCKIKIQELLDSKVIRFLGQNNILCINQRMEIKKSLISFQANNSLILIGDTFINNTRLFTYNNSTIFIGDNNFFNPVGVSKRIIAAEGKNIFIGNDNLFSVNIWIRCSDAHVLYDFLGKRINFPDSVYIGDHIWLCENIGILKGTRIHSGVTVATNSTIGNKILYSNNIYGGSPVKLVKKDICWAKGTAVNYWTATEIFKYSSADVSKIIFIPDENFIPFNKIEEDIQDIPNLEDKLIYLLQIYMYRNNNRFAASN